MKTNIFLVILALWAQNVSAQNFFVSAQSGYALGASQQSLSMLDYQSYSVFTGISERNQIYLSLGKGFNAGLSCGYNFNNNVALNLGVSYLIGSKTEAHQTFSSSIYDYSMSAKMLRLIPSISISTDFERLDVYARVGVIIGFGNVKFDSKQFSGQNIEESTLILNGGPAFGINSGIGTLFSISDKLSLFGEIDMMNMAYSPNKGIMTNSTYNGIDQLPTLTTNEKELEFLDSYTETDNSDQDAIPQKFPKCKLPFGSIGLNIGLRINF